LKMSSNPRWVGVGDMIIGPEERKAINDVLDSGRISEGARTQEFEKRWADFVGTRYSVAVNSGTSALIAGLTALQYCKNDPLPRCSKVITTPLTYVATSNALLLTGNEPTYVDVDERHFCITPETIRRYLDEEDDVGEHHLILPVHLMGYPADMDGINKLARKHGMQVMEDSSQAHGSLLGDRRTGSMSRLSTFSFYIAHNIQAGELGAIATDDLEIVKLIRQIKANGRRCDCITCKRKTTGCVKLGKDAEEQRDPRFTHDIIGYNFKAMDFQSALALVQLDRALDIIKKRQENVKYLNDGLSDLDGVLRIPELDSNVSYLAYPLILEKGARISRDKFVIELEKRRVEARPLFGSIPSQQPAYNGFRSRYEGKLPIADMLGARGMYIGCHQYLTNDDLDWEIRSMHEVLK
jgi:dTDP-4-amino-4,6-dideoxygalactose transaminase